MVNTGDTGWMLRRLMQDAHTVALEQLPGLVAGHAATAGLYDVAVFAADLRETLRRLMHSVLDHHCGRLDDDATVLMTEWRVGHQDRLVP